MPARRMPAAPAKAQWRRPLIAAAVTLALSLLVLVLGYRAMRDEAERDSAAGGERTVKQAPANAREAETDAPRRARPVPLAARGNP